MNSSADVPHFRPRRLNLNGRGFASETGPFDSGCGAILYSMGSIPLAGQGEVVAWKSFLCITDRPIMPPTCGPERTILAGALDMCREGARAKSNGHARR
jgi:hypothetical protein